MRIPVDTASSEAPPAAPPTHAPPPSAIEIVERRRGVVDLAAVGWIRGLIRRAWFPSAFQLLFLLMLTGLAVFGWGRFAPAGTNEKLFAKSNLLTLLLWALWWPAIVWVTVLFGRVWCTVCPLELTSSWTERLARRLGLKQRHLGKWMRTGALCLAIYVALHLLVAGMHVHRTPALTSLLLCGLLGTAAVVGFFFRDRAFCRGFCPLALLLRTYGRGGALAVRCGPGCRYDGGRCPNLLNPAKLDASEECQLCLSCIKTSESRRMELQLRPPFSKQDARSPWASWPVTLFAMIDSGFVAGELCEEWPAAEHAILWAPERFASWLGLEGSAGWLEGAWMLVVFPLILWLALGAMVRVARGATSMAQAWRGLAMPMIVISSTGHLAKCVEKITSWGGYLPHAIRDPAGTRTVGMLADGSLAKPDPLLPLTVVSAIGALMLVGMAFVSLRESRLADAKTHSSRVAPILAACLLAVFVLLSW